MENLEANDCTTAPSGSAEYWPQMQDDRTIYITGLPSGSHTIRVEYQDYQSQDDIKIGGPLRTGGTAEARLAVWEVPAP